MKRFCLFFIICVGLIIPTTVVSQNYLVYTVNGKVTKRIANKGESVAPKDLLSDNTYLNIPTGGKIVILDETNNTMYTLKTPGEGLVKKLINEKGNDFKKVSSQYFSYLLKRAGNSNVKRNTHMQSVGAGYRDTDSLLIEKDSLRVDSCCNKETKPTS